MGVEGIGASVVRKEDRRFITGKGRYVDDIKLVGTTHAHFVRSPHAHASGAQRCAPLSHFGSILGKRCLPSPRFGGTT